MALGVDEHAQIEEYEIKGWENRYYLFILMD
jgi:hypothetical protein